MRLRSSGARAPRWRRVVLPPPARRESPRRARASGVRRASEAGALVAPRSPSVPSRSRSNRFPDGPVWRTGGMGDRLDHGTVSRARIGESCQREERVDPARMLFTSSGAGRMIMGGSMRHVTSSLAGDEAERRTDADVRPSKRCHRMPSSPTIATRRDRGAGKLPPNGWSGYSLRRTCPWSSARTRPTRSTRAMAIRRSSFLRCPISSGSSNSPLGAFARLPPQRDSWSSPSASPRALRSLFAERVDALVLDEDVDRCLALVRTERLRGSDLVPAIPARHPGEARPLDSREAGARDGRPGPHERRDRTQAPPLGEHGEEPPGILVHQARGSLSQPRRPRSSSIPRPGSGRAFSPSPTIAGRGGRSPPAFLLDHDWAWGGNDDDGRTGDSAAAVAATSVSPAEPASPPRLVLDGVSKQWRRNDPPLLQGLDLELPPGTLALIAGRNGAGKTTLLRIVAEHHRRRPGARSGSTARRPASNRREYQRRVGFLSAGSTGVYARVSVAQHLDYWARLALVPAAERSTRVGAALDTVRARRDRRQADRPAFHGPACSVSGWRSPSCTGRR